MKEYIEREEAVRAAKDGADEWDGGCSRYRDASIESAMNAIPAADVVEVRHGRWIYDCEHTMGDGWIYKQYHCSACGKQEIGAMQNYCPNCGAKMDGGANDAFHITARAWLEKQPAVDAVPVVRCRECKHRYVDGDNVRFNLCLLNHNKVQSDDWYCADGERKGGTSDE